MRLDEGEQVVPGAPDGAGRLESADVQRGWWTAPTRDGQAATARPVRSSAVPSRLKGCQSRSRVGARGAGQTRCAKTTRFSV
jgi:hypothetical protein